MAAGADGIAARVGIDPTSTLEPESDTKLQASSRWRYFYSLFGSRFQTRNWAQQCFGLFASLSQLPWSRYSFRYRAKKEPRRSGRDLHKSNLTRARIAFCVANFWLWVRQPIARPVELNIFLCNVLPNTSFQRTQVRALRGLGPLNSDR
jgi:hypothetical protein